MRPESLSVDFGGHDLKNPYVKGNVTKLKMLLPTSKKEAWKLIATPKGLASWFPTKCRGRVRKDSSLEFGWADGSTETHRVLWVGEAHSSLTLDWWETGRVSFYLHGREPTHLTLQVTYPKSARKWQALEFVGWTFFLSNLKSAAMKGPDLRSRNSKLSWKKGYIDSA